MHCEGMVLHSCRWDRGVCSRAWVRCALPVILAQAYVGVVDGRSCGRAGRGARKNVVVAVAVVLVMHAFVDAAVVRGVFGAVAGAQKYHRVVGLVSVVVFAQTRHPAVCLGDDDVSACGCCCCVSVAAHALSS